MFTEEFKRATVQKYLSRGSRSVEEICIEAGIANPTLYQWARKYAITPGMNIKNRRPQDWSAEEKINACIEYEKLSEDLRGEFLRSKGIHKEHLAEWKLSWVEALSSPRDQRASRAEVLEASRKIKELERELYRKDKALAETTALLVLKKKADLIWGLPEG